MATICDSCGSEDCGICATCGRCECDHHPFIPVVRQSKACVCDAMEWEDPSNIPPVCDCYVGDGHKNCKICEHDVECHEKT